MIAILIILLVPALRFLNDPKRYWYFFWAPLPAFAADVIAAHTTWALVAGWPRGREMTISDTLERLCQDITHQDHDLFVQIALKINRVAGFPHIKAVAA